MGEVELARPEAQQQYTINGEVWVVMQVTYNHGTERSISLELQPLEQVRRRYYFERP